jgi:hypothetical protein
MQDTARSTSGIEQLVERWRTEFRRPENTDFYNEIDYKRAERKYIKLCLDGRPDAAVDGNDNHGGRRRKNSRIIPIGWSAEKRSS